MNYKFSFYITVLIILGLLFLLILKHKNTIKIFRVPRLIQPKRIGIDNYFGHIYGVFGLVAFAITGIGLYSSYNNVANNDFIFVLETITYSLAAIIVSYIAASMFFVAKISKLKQSEYQAEKLDRNLKNQYIVNKYQSELFHSIAHYQRNILARLLEFNKQDFKPSDIDDIKNRFHDFLVILTSNVQSYFSFITQDNCSVTIKKVCDDKVHVKPLFRDPVNFNKRKKSDEEYQENGGQYKIGKNTAFKIITDPTLKNNFFYDDKLNELADAGYYENSNPKWRELYNATIVVPISMLLRKNSRDVIGFLTVDNIKGGLANDTNKEFLFGIADLLYNVFLNYSNFIKFVEQKNEKK